MWKSGSLKRRLLVMAMASITLVWLGAAAFTYSEARDEFDEILDAHLAQAASLLTAQAAHELEEIDTEHAPLMHKYSGRVAFQVWDGGRELRLHSTNAPPERMATTERGFSNVTFGGQRWRVFSAWDESGEFMVQVAERADAREDIEEDIAENLLLPLLVSLPLLALLLWITVLRGLRPLDKLAGEVGQRAPDNLAALDASSAPREVAPLIERLNRLFARIEASMQKERRFTADAAHELRTPVAVIKAQAQVARAASGDAERIRALDNAILGCDRATRLIEQLLMLARVDTLERGLAEPCQLGGIAAETIAALAPDALEKGVRLELLADGDAATVPVVRGNPELLRVLLRNLLDNSIRHSPSGTTVQVSVAREPGAVCLSVSDNGPGIPEQEREKVLERFYRPAGTQASGSGLGLSIVKRIVEIHGATLSLAPFHEGKGLNIKIAFTNIGP